MLQVFNVQPKTTLHLPVWPRDAKRWDTPALYEPPVEVIISVVHL